MKTRILHPAKLHERSVVLVLAIVFLFCTTPVTTWANPLFLPPIVIAPPGQTILEGQKTNLTFNVFNPNPVPLILDYAMAKITTTHDTTDWLHFAGNNGSAGLGSASLIIAPFGVGQYKYNFITDLLDTGPAKDGRNDVSFGIEMSPILGNGGIFVVNVNGVFLGLILPNNPPNVVNPAVLNNLLGANPQFPCQVANGCNPFAPNFNNNQLLYQGGLLGIDFPNLTSPSVVTVFVSDTPEPSTLLMLGSGILGLGGFLRKRLLTRS
jgi:PEP-CTERM motif